MIRLKEKYWDLMFEPLLQNGVSPNVLDIGARNGMMVFPNEYAKNCNYIGFEPNQEEYLKLINGSTDSKKFGVQVASFKHEEYYDKAIWSEEGTFPFYITQGPGSCSMMGHSVKKKSQSMFRYADGGQSLFDAHAKVIREETVDCTTLDSLFYNSDRVFDYLKVDVEGAELNVYKGAKKLFENGRILFVKAEFLMVPYYKESPLLGHQHSFLDEHKMLMIDVDLNHSRYSWGRNSSVSAVEDRQFIYAGDAYFVKDPDRTSMTPEEMHRLGLISCVYGFYSFACNLFRFAELLSENDIVILEKEFSKSSMKSLIHRSLFRYPKRLKKQLTNIFQAKRPLK
ncbi:MAG: FkbM family methyltransferase [Opitutales bacterium]|nr:FkbM family methyltransferase [Opitutales bacterium]